MATSNEVKLRYNQKVYSCYTTKFRKKEDAEFIQYIEARKAAGQQVTGIFRDLIKMALEKSDS